MRLLLCINFVYFFKAFHLWIALERWKNHILRQTMYYIAIGQQFYHLKNVFTCLSLFILDEISDFFLI